MEEVPKCRVTFFLLSSAASFRSSAYNPTIHSAAPLVNTGAGLLFAYWMYFLINATLSTSTFFAACPARVLGCLPAIIPTWRSGSYLSNGLVSIASFVVEEDAGFRYQVEGIGAFVVRGRQSGDLLFRRRRRLRQIKGQIGKAASRGERCSCGGPYERHTTYGTSACKRIRPSTRAHLSIYWVCRSYNAAPRIQTCVNTGFCNCHRLLFHDFVNGNTVNV